MNLSMKNKADSEDSDEYDVLRDNYVSPNKGLETVNEK